MFGVERGRNRQNRRTRSARTTLKTATIRDFSGGWNVADDDMNLNTKYQPVADNVLHGIDGSIGPRWGYELFADFRDGVETNYASKSVTFGATNTSAIVNIAWTSHPFSDGDHITITGATAFAGLLAVDLNRTFSVRVVDANNIRIALRNSATSTANSAQTIGALHDTHTLAGNTIYGQYYNRRLVVFDDVGEVATVDVDGNITKIWSHPIAYALSGNPEPWKWTEFVNAAPVKSTLIAVNGYNRDKPIQIGSDFVTEFLVDKSTLSNSAVPRADIVLAFNNYVMMFRTEYGDPFVEFSATKTDGTFTREASPDDAVEVDLSQVTSAIEPVILGAGVLRNKVAAIFYDKLLLGTIGVFDGSANHVPDFSDEIPQQGTVAHRTVVSLGNDIFMCDYAGVPSAALSQVSSTYVPTRVSELIAPALQQHLSNLSEDTLQKKAFALFNPRDRQYMLFLPKHDETAISLPTDPVVFTPDLSELGYAIVNIPNHGLFEGDYITIAGAVAVDTVAAGDINGTRQVVSIIDADFVVITIGDTPLISAAGGGSAMTSTPVNDETICYAFTYNSSLKIRRWSRYRGWRFDWGCVSQKGYVFLGYQGKVYRYGSADEPMYGDKLGEYDYAAWANSTAYAVDERVLASDGTIWRCLVAHTSSSAGSFTDNRVNFPEYWTEYKGFEINWAFETPWSDMQERDKLKIVRMVNVDSRGQSKFTLSLFSDNFYRDPTTYVRTPHRSMEFTSGDTGGFGIGTQGWGGGRRTRDTHLWSIPVRAKLLKIRVEGSTTEHCKIIAASLLYQTGSIRK